MSGSYWQVSADGGTTWNNVPASEQYIEYPVGFLDLYIQGITPSDNGNLYRMCNPGPPTSCSVPDTLYVNSGTTSTLMILNPPSTVCAGNSVLFTASAGPYGVTNDSVSWTVSIEGSSIGYAPGVNDSTLVINFPATATGNATITASYYGGGGCGSFQNSSPVTIAIQTPASTLAGTAGGAAACISTVVYPGGQSAFNTSNYGNLSDPAVTTTATDASCDAIASILPSGSNPVAGTVTSCVTLASSVPSYNGVAYVPRYYNLEPSANASTSTATVTLYFTQADFDAYNAARGSEPALPTSPTDATGIANLRVSQFHGTGTTPDTYVGGSGTIDPADNNIVWNSTTSR